MIKKHPKLIKLPIMFLIALTAIFTIMGCADNPAIEDTSDSGIKGKITDPNGNPAPQISLLIVDGTAEFPDTPVESDSEGYYQISKVPEGTYEVVVFDKKGNRFGSKRVKVRHGKCSRADFVIPVDNEEFIIDNMPVDDISINLLESFPLQVHVVVNGTLRDGCTTINAITQKREGNIITVNITTKRPKDAMCIQVIKMVTERIPLEGTFLPGDYKVIVNGVIKEFNIQGEAVDPNNGLLRGKITIGPLCPVEPCDIPPDQVAKIYESRKVFIYDKATRAKVDEVNLDKEGFYSFSLKSGKYIVDVSDADGNALPLNERRPIGSAIPAEVEIKAGSITVLNFDIDTGIR